MVEGTLAASDAAEIEPQYREATMHERIVELVDDLMIHRAPELGMRMQHDGDRCVFHACRMVPAFDPAGRAGEDDFRHSDLNSGEPPHRDGRAPRFQRRA